MVKYVAGIDAGTTGLKTIIFDLTGKPMGKAYQEYPCITPRVGWVEQDVYCLWNALCATVKGAIEDAGVNPEEIGSVGISSQRGTFLPLMKIGNHFTTPLYGATVVPLKKCSGSRITLE